MSALVMDELIDTFKEVRECDYKDEHLRFTAAGVFLL